MLEFCAAFYRVGDIVQYREVRQRGGHVAAAIVTDVHSQDCISLYVIPGLNGSPSRQAPYYATSVSVGNNGGYVES